MEDQDRGFRRGRGGRRRERGFRERPARGKGEGPTGAHPAAASASPMKTPIILTKSSADRGQETPVKQILIKPRETLPEGVARPSVPQQAVARGKTILSDHPAGQATDRSAGATQPHGMGGAAASTVTGASANVEGITTNLASLKLGLHSRDGAPQLMKLLDENLQWNDTALEILLDQTDFLVVGIIGPQGAGKSTVLSVLGGAGPFSDSRSPLFPVQSRQVQEDGINQTSGIDLAVTQERVILLDTQPLLSAALLDHLIHHDRNIPPEYTSPENYNEIQVIASKTFLSCMGHEATNFTSTSYIAHCIILYALSHGLQRCTLYNCPIVSVCFLFFFFLQGNGICTKSPTYQGNPSFDVVLHSLRNQIFSVHRHLLTHHSLTERNWFHFAARSWETVRKSSLISEYNRLLCT
ncbi:protein SMG9-like [Orbicella faveolata]|uniref:protein SMG9-like n=1 Tax=Orbicella faveolata TaxID=48498 RepID=UPI0009E214C5|nr:protein SMG9-like [Orbicella faveolata]